MDIVDISIFLVGLAMLPLVPDLLANLMVLFLPDSLITSNVRRMSKQVRSFTNTVVSRILVVLSVCIPGFALYFQPSMLGFLDVPSYSMRWWAEIGLCSLLFIAVECMYALTLLVKPGYVVKENSDEQDGKHCRTCKLGRPKRAHHCSVCGRCVLRMDHHCPFTNCCVGLNNHGFFFLWVVGVWLGSGYGSGISFPAFRRCIWTGYLYGIDKLSASQLEKCVEMGKRSFVFLPALCIFLFMCILGGWHLLLIATNQTTIEFYRNRVAPLLGIKKSEDDRVSYSKGSVMANFRDVFFPSS